MIRWHKTNLALGASAMLMLGLLPSMAQEAPDCSFVCKLTGQSAAQLAPPAPAGAAEPVAETDSSAPASVVKAKPKIVPLSIATDAPAAASMRALAAGLKTHPVRIVGPSTPAEARRADLIVGPSVEGSAKAGAPLFREDLHIIGRAGLADLASLDGRTVSLGPEGSPDQAIARKILAARHIAVKEVPLDLDNALDGLTTGDLDAVAVFAPQPFARLKDLPAGLHLLAATSAADDDGAVAPAFIPAAAYPALSGGAAVATLSVAVQITANAKTSHPHEAAAVVAALAAKARKTFAAQPPAEMRSVAVAR